MRMLLPERHDHSGSTTRSAIEPPEGGVGPGASSVALGQVSEAGSDVRGVGVTVGVALLDGCDRALEPWQRLGEVLHVSVAGADLIQAPPQGLRGGPAPPAAPVPSR